MASSTASASLNPSAPKSLMPLSCQGCERARERHRLKSMRAGKEGNRGVARCRRFQHRSGLAQAGGESGGDPGAGLARIAAENHPGFG